MLFFSGVFLTGIGGCLRNLGAIFGQTFFYGT